MQCSQSRALCLRFTGIYFEWQESTFYIHTRHLSPLTFITNYTLAFQVETKTYCQAHPKLSFSLASALAEVSCIFDSPHPPPPGKVPKLDFLAIYVYQTSMEPQWKMTSMEDNLNGRQPQKKTTSMEDDLNGRQPQRKTASIEDDLNGRQPQCKRTSREEYLNVRWPQY